MYVSMYLAGERDHDGVGYVGWIRGNEALSLGGV